MIELVDNQLVLAMDKQLILISVLVVSLILVAVFLRYYRRNQHQRQVKKLIRDISHKSLRHVLLPDNVDGQIWIDCLLLTDGGLVVLDIRDYVGHLFGGETINEWTQMIGVKSYKFANPLHELPARVSAVQAIVGDVPVTGNIVFTHRGSFQKGQPEGVYMVDEVYEKISPFLRPALPAEKLESAWEKILAVVQVD